MTRRYSLLYLTLIVCLGSFSLGEESGGITCYRDVSPLKPCEFGFAPIRAKFVRIVMHSGDRANPCFDQLEIPGTRSPQQQQGKKRKKQELKRRPKKQEQKKKPGSERLPSLAFEDGGWGVQKSLGNPVVINRVVLSGSRDGDLRHRGPISFDIQVSMHGSAKEWATVKKVRPTTNPSSEYATFDPAALRRALDDLVKTAPDRFPDAADLRRQVDVCGAQWPALRSKAQRGDPSAMKAADKLLALRRKILLRNPLLNFERILLIKRHMRKPGLPINYHSLSYMTDLRSLDDAGPEGFENEIAVMDLKNGALSTLYRPDRDVYVGEVDLHFDGQKLMFSQVDKHNTWQIHEMGVDGSGRRQITRTHPDFTDVDNYDSVYLPDGRIIFGSTSSFAGVPCHSGKGEVANLHIMNADGSDIRRLTFEQDHDWYPVMLPNGRVMYLRWEYTDTAHYFTRIMMTMNPDGTGQVEQYGSNSYWPNAMFYARPMPGSSSKFAAIVTGHHGVRRAGRLVLFDAAKGRHETSGVIQEIPGYGKEVPATIKDRLVDGIWPRFLHPFPLGAPSTGLGAGKYFLVSCQPTAASEWGLYLVDIYDNMLPLKEITDYVLFEPVPLRKTKVPRVIPDKVNLGSKTATCFIQDIYAGQGLKGIPRGTVKRLRIFNYDYGYRGLAGHYLIGMESGWDVKRLLGTVPVCEDGSAFFKVPANLPIAIQPLDENGRALQLMRSWLVAMPGENVHCVGCHEDQTQTVVQRGAIALTRPPSDLEPWYGPARGFSFIRDVQPVLNRHCAGCHDGAKKNRPNFASTKREGKARNVAGFPHSYIALHPYVRRPGPESDYNLLTPLDFHGGTSKLVQMLEKGHHGVKLDAEGWDRINTWIDLNAPCYGTWSEVAPVPGNSIERRRELEKLYANVDITLEGLHHKADYDETFVAPKTTPKNGGEEIRVAGWPFAGDKARAMQQASGKGTFSLDLGSGLSIELVRIPAGEFVMGSNTGTVDEQPMSRVRIDKPFWMGTTEVSLEQYLQFNPRHRNRVYDMHWKDQKIPGYDMDQPELPAIRVSWGEAVAFCAWLSNKMDSTGSPLAGRKVSLPTEAQWEWACRAGTASALSFGSFDANFAPYANLADVSIKKLALKGWDYELKDARFNDQVLHLDKTTSRKPNAWGLWNMHGNVAEWTRSAYRPYPYAKTDGREDSDTTSQRVVRGGSWYDRPKRATSSFRLAYPQWQRVFNVGFRVVVEEG
jgi:formylglycine-generating enzyme required for sulfatase activity